MDVDFFMTKSQPRHCYLGLPVVLIIIIFCMGKSSHFLTHLLQMKVKLLYWSGVIGLIIGFTHII